MRDIERVLRMSKDGIAIATGTSMVGISFLISYYLASKGLSDCGSLMEIIGNIMSIMIMTIVIMCLNKGRIKGDQIFLILSPAVLLVVSIASLAQDEETIIKLIYGVGYFLLAIFTIIIYKADAKDDAKASLTTRRSEQVQPNCNESSYTYKVRIHISSQQRLSKSSSSRKQEKIKQLVLVKQTDTKDRE